MQAATFCTCSTGCTWTARTACVTRRGQGGDKIFWHDRAGRHIRNCYRRRSGARTPAGRIGATGVGATRTDSQVIYDYLTSIRPQLDIDSDIQINAATDGLLIVRYMRQLRGDALILNALGSGTARSMSEIEDYLLGLSQ